MYVLDRLTTNMIIGMSFLKRHNLAVSWLDFYVGMQCLAQNNCTCKSSANFVGATMGSLCGDMTTCSNGAWCCDYEVVYARQVAKSININVVSACAFVNMVHGDSDTMTWCMLFHLVVS